MAKVKGPLLSIEAYGVIGKKIISQTRKKVKYIKEYAKPENPRTELQQNNRNYIKLAVAEWGKEGYTELDKQAWNLYAKIKSKNMSGYNAFIKFYLKTMVSAYPWTTIKNCVIYDITQNSAKVSIEIEEDKEGILYLGSSKYYIAKEYYPEYSDGKYIFTITELLPDTKYYFYIKHEYTP